MCMLPFPDGDARWTQRLILVRAIESPTSSGGDSCIILNLSACTGVNTSVDEHIVLSHNCMELGRW